MFDRRQAILKQKNFRLKIFSLHPKKGVSGLSTVRQEKIKDKEIPKLFPVPSDKGNNSGSNGPLTGDEPKLKDLNRN